MSETTSPAPPMTCAFHPARETLLRCGQCDRPVCPKCRIEHVVGHLCKECARGRRSKYHAPGYGHLLGAAGATGGAACAIAFFFGPFLAWNFLAAILLGPAIGSGLARIALWSGRHRSGRAMQLAVGAAILVGSVLGATVLRSVVFQEGHHLLAFTAAPFFIYLFLTIGATVAWLR